MFTYLALLISCVCTVFYTIYCILAYAALTLLIHIFIFIYSYSIPYLDVCVLGSCCGIVRLHVRYCCTVGTRSTSISLHSQ